MYVKHRGPGSRGGMSKSTKRRAMLNPPTATTVIEGHPVTPSMSSGETPLQMLRRFQRTKDALEGTGPALCPLSVVPVHLVEREAARGRSPFRAFREALGLTVADVAKGAGMSTLRLRQIEDQTRKPGHEEEVAIASAVGLCKDAFLAHALRPLMGLMRRRGGL